MVGANLAVNYSAQGSADKPAPGHVFDFYPRSALDLGHVGHTLALA